MISAAVPPPAAVAAKRQTVGNPAQPGRLPAQLLSAYAAGARRITIRPGIYRLPYIPHTIFPLNHWRNATIAAANVEIIMAVGKQSPVMFSFNHCANVTLTGPTLSQNRVTFYQGRVLRVGARAGHAFCDWRPDAGYPRPAGNLKKFFGTIDVVSGRTHRIKPGNGDIGAARIKAVKAGVFRLFFTRPVLHFHAGDLLVGRWGKAGFKVDLAASRGCVIKHVTLLRNGFAPIFEHGAGGGNKIISCTWKLGPKPNGAVAAPVVTNQADGFHSVGANPGPELENCTMHGVFLDDCIAIHGTLQNVLSVQGRTLLIKGANHQFAAGKPIRLSNATGFFAQAMVAAVKHLSDGNQRVTLAGTLAVPPGCMASNPLRDGAGYRVIGCRIGDTRSRGMLLKGDNGLVENNLIVGCGMPGISLGPEYWWHEGDYVHHVRVIGNTLRNNGGAVYGGPALFIHGHGAIGNGAIEILRNSFETNYQGAIGVHWAKGVTIRGNTITLPASLPPGIRPHPPAIFLAHCTGITIRGNHIRGGKAAAGPIISRGKGVSGVVVK